MDNLVLHNADMENSGQFVASTLFSLSRTPRTFVCQIPWPVVGQTINAKVSITQGGALVPVLAYFTSWPGSPIPVVLDEM